MKLGRCPSMNLFYKYSLSFFFLCCVQNWFEPLRKKFVNTECLSGMQFTGKNVTDWCVLYGSSVGGYNEERALLARSQHNPRASEQLIPIHSAVVCPPAALFSWPRSGHYALSEGVRGAQPGHAPSADSEALGAFTGIPQGFHREFTGISQGCHSCCSYCCCLCYCCCRLRLFGVLWLLWLL